MKAPRGVSFPQGYEAVRLGPFNSDCALWRDLLRSSG